MKTYFHHQIIFILLLFCSSQIFAQQKNKKIIVGFSLTSEYPYQGEFNKNSSIVFGAFLQIHLGSRMTISSHLSLSQKYFERNYTASPVAISLVPTPTPGIHKIQILEKSVGLSLLYKYYFLKKPFSSFLGIGVSQHFIYRVKGIDTVTSLRPNTLSPITKVDIINVIYSPDSEVPRLEFTLGADRTIFDNIYIMGEIGWSVAPVKNRRRNYNLNKKYTNIYIKVGFGYVFRIRKK